MAAWRRHARRFFPILHHDLNTAQYALTELSHDLRLMMWEALSAADDHTLHTVFTFTAWCLGQEHRAAWLATTVKQHFYMTLFDDRTYWSALMPWISLPVRSACWPLWCERWPSRDRKRFEAQMTYIDATNAPTGYEI